eukprot:14509359-Alexandrium_andersonii.AAC.1
MRGSAKGEGRRKGLSLAVGGPAPPPFFLQMRKAHRARARRARMLRRVWPRDRNQVQPKSRLRRDTLRSAHVGMLTT